MALNKAQLVDAVAENTGLKKTDIEKCLKGFVDAISDELANGGSVTLIGFGTFKVSKREARQGIKPGSSETIEIPAKTVAKFKPGKTLADKVNADAQPAEKPAAKKSAKKK